MTKIIYMLTLVTALALSGCNTVKGTAHGMGKDFQAVTGTGETTTYQKTSTTTSRYPAHHSTRYTTSSSY